MELKKMIRLLIKIFWIFLIGCIFGFILETLVILIGEGHLESRKGLLYGPFTPVYGVGAVVYYLILPKLKNNTLIFIVSMLLGGIIEYLYSFVQEKAFGTVAWEYSDSLLNIHGRTALIYLLCWGLIGILFIYKIYPLFNKLDKYVDKKGFNIVTIILVLFMTFNITLSCMTACRQRDRLQNIEAKNKIDIFFDEKYPDYIMNRIYANKIQKGPIK